jgi:hypothetical protein
MDTVMDFTSIANLGAAVVITVVFIRYLMTKDASQAERDEKLARSFQAVATATKQAAKEAKDRNGHLAEIAVENQKTNAAMLKQILEGVPNGK